jgi:deoxyribose-phosphate aldolase
MTLTPTQLAATLDSTNLRLDATETDIQRLCEEAATLGCACVMIYPTSIPLARKVLAGTSLAIGTVIGFPSGRFSTEGKASEIAIATKAGAREVDIVMDYSALKAGRLSEVAHELAELTTQAHAAGALIKVITENCYLDEPLMLQALRLCEDSGVDFIKTSTGFGSHGAKVEHIALWAKHRRGSIRLKAAGGIRTLADATTLLTAGAARLGTSNAGAIVAELKGTSPASSASGSY